MQWRDYITVDQNICHGKACFIGTRVPVTIILDNLAENVSPDEIMKSYPGIKKDYINAALAYAADLANERVLELKH